MCKSCFLIGPIIIELVPVEHHMWWKMAICDFLGRGGDGDKGMKCMVKPDNNFYCVLQSCSFGGEFPYMANLQIGPSEFWCCFTASSYPHPSAEWWYHGALICACIFNGLDFVLFIASRPSSRTVWEINHEEICSFMVMINWKWCATCNLLWKMT